MRYLGATLFLLPLVLCAQRGPVRVAVEADTTILRIGEQMQLLLTVENLAANQRVQWPVIGDTLSAQVEVISAGKVDSSSAADGRIRNTQTLTITAFDSGFWAIRPFRFVVDGTELYTEALLLDVRSVPSDSSLLVRDIKDIITLPFSLSYWLRQHAGWIGTGAAVLLAVILLIRYLRRRKPTAQVSPPEKVAPLHERVLAALATLENERVWQRGDHKMYHSRITDLLRSYIEERYRVPAMESTTDELIKELRVSPLTVDHRIQLENMLKLADMVKFAKALPSPQENEQMMLAATRFVATTAAEPSTDEAHA